MNRWITGNLRLEKLPQNSPTERLMRTNKEIMDQETRWFTRYQEVMDFIEINHRNPSKHRIEEHDMLNWVKQQRKLHNAEAATYLA